MITYDHIMIRFGELSTKGKNKKDFIRTLADNIKNALKDWPELSFETRYDHIYVGLNNLPYEPIIERLQDVSGIHALSLVYRASKDIEDIKNSALALMKEEHGKTFKVKVKRGDKTYPIISDEITRIVAGHVLRNTPELKVDVHNPEILLSIEVRQEAAYIFCKTFLERGVSIECIHFASPPYTQMGVIYKLEDLLHVLNRYQTRIRLHIVPFTKIQEAIYDNAPESYCITLMRRMMFRLADALSKRRKCPVISSGESIGQVASQTLQSMHVINAVTNTPVIRPLATTDKLEIIAISKKIGTYDISIRPYEDCCTIFTPKAPKTMPHQDEVEEFEKKFDYETLIKDALNNIEVKIITPETKQEDLL